IGTSSSKQDRKRFRKSATGWYSISVPSAPDPYPLTEKNTPETYLNSRTATGIRLRKSRAATTILEAIRHIPDVKISSRNSATGTKSHVHTRGSPVTTTITNITKIAGSKRSVSARATDNGKTARGKLIALTRSTLLIIEF